MLSLKTFVLVLEVLLLSCRILAVERTFKARTTLLSVRSEASWHDLLRFIPLISIFIFCLIFTSLMLGLIFFFKTRIPMLGLSEEPIFSCHFLKLRTDLQFLKVNVPKCWVKKSFIEYWWKFLFFFFYGDTMEDWTVTKVWKVGKVLHVNVRLKKEDMEVQRAGSECLNFCAFISTWIYRTARTMWNTWGASGLKQMDKIFFSVTNDCLNFEASDLPNWTYLLFHTRFLKSKTFLWNILLFDKSTFSEMFHWKILELLYWMHVSEIILAKDIIPHKWHGNLTTWEVGEHQTKTRKAFRKVLMLVLFR